MKFSRFAIVALVALTSCGWTQPDFDAGRSRGNGLEAKLTASTVGSLVGHTIPSEGGASPSAVVAVLGKQLITQQGRDVVAYDRHNCPRANNGPCTPLWTKSGATFATSDGSTTIVFVTDDRGDPGIPPVFEATDLALGHLWTSVATVADSVRPDLNYTSFFTGFAISGAKLVVDVGLAYTPNPRTGVVPDQRQPHLINVFNLRGCGADLCAPQRTVATGVVQPRFFTWLVDHDTLVSHEPTTGLGFTAFNLNTGGVVWTAAPGTEIRSAVIRGHRLFAATEGSVQAFDVTGHSSCAGVPTVCTPVWTSTNPSLFALHAASDRVAVGQNSEYDNTPAPNTHTIAHLSFFDPAGSGCSGSTCAPIATTTPVTDNPDGLLTVSTTNSVVFALTRTNQINGGSSHLFAYDARGAKRCSGSPTVCSPLVALPLPLVDLVNTGDAPVIWDGRVYVSGTSDGLMHVFSLPGDVT